MQLCDKGTIVSKMGLDRVSPELGSGSEFSELGRQAQKLRDHLAHSQDIVTGTWPQVVTTAERIENLIKALEEFEPGTSRVDAARAASDS